MKESHRKGVANHPDPESCVGSCKAVGEALTGAHAGWVLSCEIIATGVLTSFNKAESNTDGCALASIRWTPRSQRPQACMETPRQFIPAHPSHMPGADSQNRGRLHPAQLLGDRLGDHFPPGCQ